MSLLKSTQLTNRPGLCCDRVHDNQFIKMHMQKLEEVLLWCEIKKLREEELQMVQENACHL